MVITGSFLELVVHQKTLVTRFWLRNGASSLKKSAFLSSPVPGTQRMNGSSSRFLSYRIAIVGSGPSGCYTAKYLTSALEKQGIVGNHRVDVIERLPTPYGLVRYGVAPDHPEVKNVQNDFDQLFEKGVQFYGNVQVGRHVTVDELRQAYDAVVLAYGCESDRKLNLPGEDLDGVLSAREFVAWYNGHPDYVHIGQQVARALGSNDKTRNAFLDASVVVVGQGNVALDCARILAKGGNGLYETDMAAHALPVLAGGAKDVSIVGRRGHVQGAFTIKELRELVKLEEEGYGASFVVRNDELDLGTTAASLEELASASGRPKKRIDKLLRDTAAKANLIPNAPKRVHLRFLLNPVRFESESNSAAVRAVVCERTRLEGSAGQQVAVGTGETETIPAQLVLVSIGYKGMPLAGTEQWFIASRGLISNEHGRVSGAIDDLGGLYVSGWLKRGPNGIIGTNIADAKDTVASVVEDLAGTDAKKDAFCLDSMLRARAVNFIKWDGYQRIQQIENSKRRSVQQSREKITSIAELMEAAALK